MKGKYIKYIQIILNMEAIKSHVIRSNLREEVTMSRILREVLLVWVTFWAQIQKSYSQEGEHSRQRPWVTKGCDVPETERRKVPLPQHQHGSYDPWVSMM